VCIRIYLKSDLMYIREHVCEDPWLFFEATRRSASKNVWQAQVYGLSFANALSYADRIETFLHNLRNIAWIEIYGLFSFACWDTSLPEYLRAVRLCRIVTVISFIKGIHSHSVCRSFIV
jgi:hypothetical protein